ncbi:hypothetical protein [Haloplasma contractile]|nr:hypothetical protein [Haloplasma contractile]
MIKDLVYTDELKVALVSLTHMDAYYTYEILFQNKEVLHAKFSD